MKRIKSCGFVAYRRGDKETEYLIIKSTNGDIGFPKGHMEDGESELETALRELREETGVTVEPIPGFRREAEYPLPGRNDAVKLSVYFLGRCLTENIIPQAGEVTEAFFLPYEEASMLLTYDSMRCILRDAKKFIEAQKRV